MGHSLSGGTRMMEGFGYLVETLDDTGYHQYYTIKKSVEFSDVNCSRRVIRFDI